MLLEVGGWGGGGTKVAGSYATCKLYSVDNKDR